MTELLVVGAGGFVGAVARYGLSAWVQRQHGTGLPFGTLAVNLLGCLIIGALMGVVEERQGLSPNARLFLLTGLVGSLTTFSTFGYETFALLRSAEVAKGLVYLLGSVCLGLGAVLVARNLVRFVAS